MPQRHVFNVYISNDCDHKLPPQGKAEKKYEDHNGYRHYRTIHAEDERHAFAQVRSGWRFANPGTLCPKMDKFIIELFQN